MPPTPGNPAPRVEVIPATREQGPILANLLELYIHDFSEFVPLDLDPTGRFGYTQLPQYWSESGRHPLLIYVDGKLAGLALVKLVPGATHDTQSWDMAEFFIVRGYRRKGIGSEAARQVWSRFPGAWNIRVMQANTKATSFWRHAIASFVGHDVEPVHIVKDSKPWWVFPFESPAKP